MLGGPTGCGKRSDSKDSGRYTSPVCSVFLIIVLALPSPTEPCQDSDAHKLKRK